MRSTLLLRFAGVLQSWGTDSRFEIRRTELLPTKSGIIGFLAAALGRRRNEEFDDLSHLRIGVRADQPGTLISDFHTARKDGKPSYITTRYYLADAVFLIGIESESIEQLQNLAEVVRHPVFPLYLGRRSCVPELPIFEAVVEQPLEQALRTFPYQGTADPVPDRLHLYIEGGTEGTLRRMMDDPISYDFHYRQYRLRELREIMIENPKKSSEPPAEDSFFATDHDVLEEMEGML